MFEFCLFCVSNKQRSDLILLSPPEADAFGSSSSLTERKRRTLPQLPVDDPRAKTGVKGPGLKGSEIGEKQDTELQEKESHLEHKGDGESLTPMEDGEMPGKLKHANSTSSPSKPPLRTGSSERRKRSEERKGGGGEGGGEGGEGGEKSGKPLVRQGSFTIEKPSANVPTELIPRINRGGRERSDSVGSMDTATLLKDTEAVMAFLEAKLRDENKLDQRGGKTNTASATSQGRGSGYPPPRTGSISPESDVDTASTASQVAMAGEAERKAAAGTGGGQKRRSLSSLHREKSNMSTASKTSTTATARERLERKTKTRTTEVCDCCFIYDVYWCVGGHACLVRFYVVKFYYFRWLSCMLFICFMCLLVVFDT